MNNNIVLDKQSYVKLQHSIAKDNQPSIKTIYNRQQNIIQEVRIKNLDKEVFVDIKAPFAAGTYIRLEAIQQQNDTINDAGTLNTIYWREKLYARKPNDKNFEIMPHESRQTFITGQYIQAFYLSTPKEIDLLRQKGYVDFTYIVYASSIKHFDNNTAQLKFNLNFEVGVGNDDNVREAKRNYQQTTTKSTIKKPNYNQQYIYNNAINDTISQQDRLKYFNQLEHIYSVAEAVAFLKVLPQEAKDDFSKYVIQNPQIACKIAYIYYRFDLGNEDFIKNIASDNGAYVEDRDDFINKISKVYTGGLCNSLINMPKVCNFINANTRNYKQEFENAFLGSGNADWQQLIEIFINDICDELNIEQNFRPRIDTNPNRCDSGTYRRIGNTLSVKPPNGTKNSFIDFIDTIIHEFRHFYFWYIFEDAQAHKLTKSGIAKLIYHKIYIDWKYDKIFNAYDKECAIFDAEVKKCFSGKKYSARKDSTPLYFIQPSERDSRVVAWKFRQKTGVE